ncbi:MAG: hypothetical protein WAK48_04600, partial [Candidatus Acidiferrum sp.]
QHQFTKMGHRDLLVTQTYLNQQATTAPFIPREASAAGWLRSNGITAGYWAVVIKFGHEPETEDPIVRFLFVHTFDFARHRLSVPSTTHE